MKLKKVATITQEEAIENKRLEEESEELNFTVLEYNLKRRAFLNKLFSKYLDPLGATKSYTVKNRGIYTLIKE